MADGRASRSSAGQAVACSLACLRPAQPPGRGRDAQFTPRQKAQARCCRKMGAVRGRPSPRSGRNDAPCAGRCRRAVRGRAGRVRVGARPGRAARAELLPVARRLARPGRPGRPVRPRRRYRPRLRRPAVRHDQAALPRPGPGQAGLPGRDHPLDDQGQALPRTRPGRSWPRPSRSCATTADTSRWSPSTSGPTTGARASPTRSAPRCCRAPPARRRRPRRTSR